jgi:hypothetical protein
MERQMELVTLWKWISKRGWFEFRGDRKTDFSHGRHESRKCAMRRPLWWLSYADDNGFRGVVITRARSFLLACTRAHLLNVSPGGQVQGFELPPEADDEIKLEDLDRCLNEEESRAYT